MIKTATETQNEISETLDRQILESLKGTPILDAEGKEIGREPPSAAVLNAAINRLKQCGVATNPETNPTVGNIVNRLRLVGQMPPVDQEEDDYATAAAG